MRPALEVADIFRRHGAAYRAEHAATLSNGQRRVMGAIEACRTSALGGHVEQCAVGFEHGERLTEAISSRYAATSRFSPPNSLSNISARALKSARGGPDRSAGEGMR